MSNVLKKVGYNNVRSKKPEVYSFPDNPDYQSMSIYFGQFGGGLALLTALIEPAPAGEVIIPIAGAILSGGVTFTVDQFDRLFIAPGLSIGRTLVAFPMGGMPAITYTQGYIERGEYIGPDGNGSKEEINLLTSGLGRNHSICSAVFPCFGRTYSLSNSTNAWEWGFGVPAQVNLITINFGFGPYQILNQK